MKLLKLIGLVFIFFITSLFLINARPASRKFPLKTPDSMIINHAGYPREMEAAKNELHVLSGDRLRRRPRTIFPEKATAEKVRRRAQSLDHSKKYKIYLVLYEKDQARNENNRCVLTDEILVETKPGVTIPQSFLDTYNITISKPAGHLPENFYLLVVHRTGTALAVAQALRENKEIILSAEPLLSQPAEVNVMPNDSLINSQWHLNNTGQSGGTPGIDCNVSPVWGNPYGSPGSILGRNIRIGIVDSGVQTNHPDLAPNIDIVQTNHHDFADNDSNPSPRFFFALPLFPNFYLANFASFHGTAVAGLAGAQGNNNLGVSGTAPEAILVGIRIPLSGVPHTVPWSDNKHAEWVDWKNDIIQIKNHSYGYASSFNDLGLQTSSALKWGSLNGRQGKGSIHVWSAGNHAAYGKNANYEGAAKSIYTISVGAINHNGQKSFYSNPGACLVVSAPVDGSANKNATTTDIQGITGYNLNTDYTTNFNGTSAAAPMISGVVALILEKNTNLGWRDVKEILIRSAKKNDELDPDWITNAANYHFNHKYGAGLVDAGAAVALAGTWTNLGQQQMQTNITGPVPVGIPDNNNIGITRTFDLTTQTNLRVEHVAVEVAISHTNAGDINIEIISPNDTSSTLAKATTLITNKFPNKWEFTTVRNWGEDSKGTWTLKVADLKAGNIGQLNSAKLTIYGTLNPLPKANQTITIQPVPQKTCGDSPFNIIASATSGLPVTLQKVSGPITLNGNTVTITGWGPVTISANQAGNVNWNPAPAINYNFNIAPPVTVPFHRYWSDTFTDHFYTTLHGGNVLEWYNYEGIEGHIVPNQVPGTVPLYRYYSPAIPGKWGDHHYTTDPIGDTHPDWSYELIAGYVCTTQLPGTIPMHRYWNPMVGDHFLTTLFGDLNGIGYQYEGVRFYVFP